jgi:hypothetical protein
MKRGHTKRGFFMELEEWLKIYQAATLTSGVKERSYWTILGVFLLTHCVLILALAFLSLTHTLHEARFYSTVLSGIGIFIALCWFCNERRAARAMLYWEGLLRGLEGEFAGAEFHRSFYKLLHNEQVCLPAADWKCAEWYPTVEHLSWFIRNMSRWLLAFLPILFLIAWIALFLSCWYF